MSFSPATPTQVPTSAVPQSGHPYEPLRAPLSAGLAVGLVLCPVAFILLVVAFRRVARRGDVFAQLPTARRRNEQRIRRLDLAKFMRRGSRPHGSTSPLGSDGDRRSASPILPLYTLPTQPPPVYTPPSSALPAYDTPMTSRLTVV